MPYLRRLTNQAIWKLGSIRVRLTLWYVLLLAVTLTGYSAILVVSLSRGLEASVDRVLNDAARQATGVLEAVRDEADLHEEFRRISVGTIIGLYDLDGYRLIAGRSLPPPLNHPRPLDETESRLETLSADGGASWRVLVQGISQPGAPERMLVVARASSFVGVAANELAMVIGLTTPLVLLLAIAGGVFLAGRALNPIDQIARTADAISAEDLSRRLNLPRTQDEVGRLAATFDRMLDRLDQAFQQQRRFTADASHELRTPLAMLVSRAGLALERPRTADEYQGVLLSIRDDGMRLGRIVNDLLMLARADAGDVVACTERLDAGELVGSVVEAMAPLASERGIELRARTRDSLEVDGDQTRLMQLLVNLVDNALTHTPTGGQVVVSAFREVESLVLQVTDTGCGIPAEHLPHVFERFFRGDRDGRSERAGAGLGLSLCLSIARAHGGDIRIESQPGKGTRVTVRLPLASDWTPRGNETPELAASSPRH